MAMHLLSSIPDDFEDNSPSEEERLCFYVLFAIFEIHLLKFLLIPSIMFIVNPNEDNMGILITIAAFCLISLFTLEYLIGVHVQLQFLRKNPTRYSTRYKLLKAIFYIFVIHFW